jgi:hypothetical protein
MKRALLLLTLGCSGGSATLRSADAGPPSFTSTTISQPSPMGDLVMAIAIDRGANRLYATVDDRSTGTEQAKIEVIDTTSDTITGTVSGAPTSVLEHIVADETTHTIYASGAGQVWKIDGATSAVVAGPLAIPSGVVSLAIDGAHGRLYAGGSAITIISLSSFGVSSTVPLGDLVSTLQLAADPTSNRLWVCGVQSGGQAAADPIDMAASPPTVGAQVSLGVDQYNLIDCQVGDGFAVATTTTTVVSLGGATATLGLQRPIIGAVRDHEAAVLDWLYSGVQVVTWPASGSPTLSAVVTLQDIGREGEPLALVVNTFTPNHLDAYVVEVQFIGDGGVGSRSVAHWKSNLP